MKTIILFSLETGGYPGPFFTVRLRGTLLQCTLTPAYAGAAETRSIEIAGNEAWQELVSYLATRRWKPLYTDHEILDGTHWSLRFTHMEQGVAIRCCGSNSYPPGFRKMLRLVNKVLDPLGMEVY